MANFFSVLFIIATVVFGLHMVTCQVVTAAAMCPCLVPISAASPVEAIEAAPVSGMAYAPEPGAQALRITENGLEASQASSRRQNMNAQSNVSQRRQNMNAQSNVSQNRRQNLNAQSQVSQSS